MNQLLSLNDGNQKELILFPELSIDWWLDQKRNFEQKSFDPDDNILWVYMEYLIDDIISDFDYSELGELWRKFSPRRNYILFVARLII